MNLLKYLILTPLVLFSFFCLFFACTHDTPKTPTVWGQKRKVDSINKSEGDILFRKNNAITDWNKSGLYSYMLQDSMINQRISFTGSIKDIIKKESKYVFKISGDMVSNRNKYIAEISVDSTRFFELKMNLPQTPILLKGAFVFTINKIQSMYPELSSEVEWIGENEDDVDSYITYDFSQSLLQFKGDLIDFYIYK